MANATITTDPLSARRRARAGRFICSAAVALIAFARPSGALDIDAALPERGGNAADELLRRFVTAARIADRHVRAANDAERASLFVRLRSSDFQPGDPTRRVLDALGITGVHAQLTSDGDRLRLIACTIAEPDAPPLPLANARSAAPSLDGGASASLALNLDTSRAVPWLVATVKRFDPYRGQFLQDGLEVLKWNLNMDLEGGLVGQFRGPLRVTAGEHEGRLQAIAFAPLRDRAVVERTLSLIAFGSRFVAGTMPSLRRVSNDEDAPYEIKAPGFIGEALVCAAEAGALATASERPARADWRDAALSLRLGGGSSDATDCCAAASVDVARAAGHVERLAHLLQTGYDASHVAELIRSCGGLATCALKVDGKRLIAWGTWSP